MANAPTWNINDTVYLEASAKLGFLESYLIYSIHKTTYGWVYQINVTQKLPADRTVGDSLDLKQSTSGSTKYMYFKESELISFREALDIAILNLDSRSTKLKAIRDQHFPSGST